MYIRFQLVAFIREHVAQGLFNGYSMRLLLTLASSINDLWLVKLVYIGIVVPLSWSVFPFVCFTCLLNKINKLRKYKSLRRPSYFKIYSYSSFGPTTTIYIYIFIYKFILYITLLYIYIFI